MRSRAAGYLNCEITEPPGVPTFIATVKGLPYQDNPRAFLMGYGNRI
jgi:hypothetical protein